MSDGDQVEICPKYIKKVKSVKTGKVYVDNQVNEKIANDVVIDRQKLADSGLVMLVAQIDANEHKLITKPKVVSYGLVPDKEDRNFSKEMEGVIDQFMVNGSARFARFVGSVIRPMQTGYLYHYAFFMIIGLMLVLTWVLVVGENPLIQLGS
jgi:ribonuclease J